MKKCIRIPTQLPFSGLEPTEYITNDMLTNATPNELGRSVYASECGKLDAGVWQCEPNRHEMTNCPYDEFVYLIEGELEITNEDGSKETYNAGDSFVMPKGCNCVWDVKQAIKKLYVVLE